MLLETIGIHPYPTYLREENPKLTNKEDIERFEALIKKKEKKMTAIRVGNGYDAHRFVEGRPLVLGGVEIPFEYGLLGHSDADVLLHAIMDALLGALSLGDIGKHFPDSDEAYRGISSVNLLLSVAKMMREHGANLVNLDATMVIQRPKISPYINNMVDNIAFALSVPRSCINIKATTEEGMGFTGRMEGASAYAVCILSVENN
jgi:2-C-methyl-D-erythritol 2,4-cyclodiphosphate synthase